MNNKQQFRPQGAKEPVHIRRNVEAFSDPYIEEENLPEGSVCSRCGSVYSSGRWYPPNDPPAHSAVDVKTSRTPAEKTANSRSAEAHPVLCPACRKLRDHVPGGILKLTGGFVWDHKDEILNLIRNETSKAMGINPLERVMSLEAHDGEIEITTTNEKLAQRLGKALHKAYDGTIEYKWSADTKLARVIWRRES